MTAPLPDAAAADALSVAAPFVSRSPRGLPLMRFGRETCGDLAALERLEWLVANGIGGYAGGTLAGSLARGYHGMLVAALEPPVGRTLMLAGLVETVAAGDDRTPLSTIRWHGGTVAPDGWLHLESVTIEGTIPTWRYAAPGFTIEKTVFMDHGANVTRVEYRALRADYPLTLTLEALTDFRDYHSRTFLGRSVEGIEAAGDTLRVPGPGRPANDLFLVCAGGRAEADGTPWRGFDLARERARGLTDAEDHLRAGSFEVTLAPGATVQLAASAGAPAEPDPGARETAAGRARDLLAQVRRIIVPPRRPDAVEAPLRVPPAPPPWIDRLALAADQFVVRRRLRDGTPGHSVIAGYHWFADWGRDTMIALPGLTLATGRPVIARSILSAFADVVDGGMIPNRFPDGGEPPEYNTVDAMFWFAEAVAATWRATGDDGFLERMLPVLEGAVAALERGTRYGIRLDGDGLVRAGEPGVQLTWMDAKVGERVVTPRIGKPVEVNALWLTNLAFLAQAADRLGGDRARYDELRMHAVAAFERFWNPETGHAFDVIDGPEGCDPTLRPNQILAARAATGAFDPARRLAIVEVCARRLLTHAGLRSLDPAHPDYRPHYGGDQTARDGAYHQGTVWAWLIGPFVEAHLDAYRDPDRAAAVLAPMADQLAIEAVGTVGEIFEGAAPHAPAGCVAQAWSVAEILRAWRLIETARARDAAVRRTSGPSPDPSPQVGARFDTASSSEPEAPPDRGLPPGARPSPDPAA